MAPPAHAIVHQISPEATGIQSVSVDMCVLALLPEGKLGVVVVKQDGEYLLPGGLLRGRETVDKAARRVVAAKVGLELGEVHQLRVFDDPDRDSRGRVIAVALFAAVPYSAVQAAIDGVHDASAQALLVELVPVDGTLVGALKYGHAQMVEQAVQHLRGEYELRPDPYRFLDKEEVTLLELRTAHEAVAGVRILKDTFRRRMTPKLIDTGRVTQGLLGKPARLFTRKPTAGPRAVHLSDWLT